MKVHVYLPIKLYFIYKQARGGGWIWPQATVCSLFPQLGGHQLINPLPLSLPSGFQFGAVPGRAAVGIPVSESLHLGLFLWEKSPKVGMLRTSDTDNDQCLVSVSAHLPEHHMGSRRPTQVAPVTITVPAPFVGGILFGEVGP